MWSTEMLIATFGLLTVNVNFLCLVMLLGQNHHVCVECCLCLSQEAFFVVSVPETIQQLSVSINNL